MKLTDEFTSVVGSKSKEKVDVERLHQLDEDVITDVKVTNQLTEHSAPAPGGTQLLP